MANGHNGHGNSKEHKEDHLEDYLKKAAAADRLANTIELHHKVAYNNAATQHLLNEEGMLDYDKLKKRDVQDKFVSSMTDTYVEQARNYFKMGKDHKLDEFQTDALLRAYQGITKSELKETLRRLRHEFTLERFGNVVGQVKGQVQQRLQDSIAASVEDEHIDDLIKGMGVDDKIDSSKVPLNRAKELLQIYHRNDRHLPKSAYEDEPYAKKAEAPKEAAHAHAGHGH